MRRVLGHFLFVSLLGTIAAVLGVATALVLTPPGRDLLARTVSSELSRALNGSIEVGSISGSFLYDLTIEHLVVRDTNGVLLAALPKVRVGYRLPNLLAGRFVLSRLQVDQPVLQIIKHRNGRMNYEDVLGLGRTKGNTSPLIVFNDVRVRHGTLRLATPWSPPPSVDTQRERDSTLAAERAKPGRRIESSPEGLRRVIELAQLTAALPRIQISTPDRQAFALDLDTLAAYVSDPQIEVRDAAGRVRFPHDSVVFSLSRGALPHTRFSGGGAVTWPRDTALYDFEVVAPQASLADLRWISPKFPDMTGSAVVAAHSESGTRTAYVITDLHLRHGDERIDGGLTFVDDHRRGIGARDLHVTLRNLDVDKVRPFAPGLPFYGTVTGSLEASGFLDALNVRLDWDFTDAKVAGNPVSHLEGEGRVALGGKAGLAFDNFAVRQSDVDLGTVRRLAPAVILPGRLAASGTLDGPLHDVTFAGTARQQDDGRPPSELQGTVTLDTRGDTLGLTTDVALEPLSFAGIRRAFPSLTARGSVTGRVRLDGTLADLAVNASLSGEIGTIEAVGHATVLPPLWGADGLRLNFRSLNLAAVRDTGPPTLLNGTAVLTGTADSARAPEGQFMLALTRSRVSDYLLDTLTARGAVHDSVIALDTLAFRAAAVTVQGGGTLGWAPPHDGRMHFAFTADSLGIFDSLLASATGLAPDTAADSRPLGGAASGTVLLSGNLDSLAMNGTAAGRDLVWRRFRTPAATMAAAWDGGVRPRVTGSARVDSLLWGQRVFHDATAAVSGWADSLGWTGGVTIGTGVRSSLAAQGRWWKRDSTRGGIQVVAVDTLTARLAAHAWRLAAPATVTLSDSAPAVTPVTLNATDGSGRIRLSGRVPGERAGAVEIEAFGVGVRDLYGLLQKDTTGVSGVLGTSLRLAGTARMPVVKGTAWLEDLILGDFHAPFAHAIVDYADRRLHAHAGIFRTGNEVVEVNGELPLDLALTGATRRQLPGPLLVRARADSADLSILEAVSSGIRDVQGQLVAEATIQGTWDDPQVSGSASVSRGAMTIPGIGVRYAAILGRAEFRRDSLLIPYALVTSGGGTLEITGGIRLENLSRPLLHLDLEANQFRMLDIRNFLAATVSGHVELRGPVLNATATGHATVDQGVLYFADLVNKSVIDLSDPSIADLVDTTLIRQQNLGTGFENRFLDSLRVDSLRLDMGNGVFLRSNEANIQLTGQLTLNKVRREYRPAGTLEAVRGIYTLKIPPITRDFTVDHGTVRYFGTPDLNAELDIAAEHTVRSRQGDEIPITAHITGTLRAPQLSLESTAAGQLSETDLLSYLVTGVPASEAATFGQQQALSLAQSYLASAASSELERALISDLGVPIDYVEIQPGLAQVGGGAASLTRLAFGWRIGPKTFVTLNAGYCSGQQTTTSTVNFGASLEYHFSRAWRAQTSFEPTFSSCIPGNATKLNNSYQIGADLFWQREF
ncbi:MAG TPA: translocation/assembly module TamB domain-containing protein [Gemmatimonadales bacterium]|nr:translocation/assembly module TamB domain-containing protein [Gemmatimonadales bacterium]